MKKLIGAFFIALVSVIQLHADPEAKIEGTVILAAVAGYDAANISFTTISWTNNDSGSVTDSKGNKTAFLNEAVRKIVYYDADYYTQIDQRADWFAARFGIKKYEVIADTVDSINLTNRDVSKIQMQQESLEAIVQIFSSSSSLLGPPIATLRDDLDRLSKGQKMLNGKWMSQEELETQPLPQSVGDTNETITFVTKEGMHYDNVTAHITNAGLSLITDNGGATVAFDDLPDDFAGFPKNLSEQIVRARLEALVDYENSDPSTVPAAFREKEYGSSYIAVFMNEAEAIGKQSQNISSIQKELSEDVTHALLKNLPISDNKNLIRSEWPKLKKTIAFAPQQQIDFYTCLIEKGNLTLDECKDVLAEASSTTSPSELKDFVAKWNDQVLSADKLCSQMEKALISFFSVQSNMVILKASEAKEELMQGLDFGSDGNTAFKAISAQLAQSDLPCVQSVLQRYQNSWAQLSLIPKLRSSLASGKLSDVESIIPQLNSDTKINDTLTPGQKLVYDACTFNLALYKSQKTTAQKLLDEAERFRALGGQNSKALQDYKDAYQLNNDPAILDKIADLNRESLGI